MVKLLRARAAWMIALLAVSLTTVEFPHLGSHHDADCDLVVVVHDASAHRIDGAAHTPQAPPEHCLACHWGRSFQCGADPAPLVAPAVAVIVTRVVERQVVPARSQVAQPPLRSPPVSPRLA